MEKLVRIDQRILDKQSDINPFALERVRVESGVFFEYLLEGVWTTCNLGRKPEGKRTVFRDLESFRAAKDVYFAWQYFESLKSSNPVFPEKIITRLMKSHLLQEPLTIFIPWGVRPEGEPKFEDAIMDKIQNFANQLTSFGISSQVLIMPADLYATEVNNIDQDLTDNYFSKISDKAIQRGFKVKSWSEIRNTNYGDYQKLSSTLTGDEIKKILPEEFIFKAIQTARKRSGYTEKEDVENAAYRYLRERICEAEIIEKSYSPIKFSLVSKNKDNYVDRNLPRIYVVPQGLQFPWLK